jgi:cobalamin biosynthetic protein CobC
MSGARVEHGGALDAAIARHGGRAEDWLDLSTGINPWAWPWPAPMPTLSKSCMTRLPLQADLDRLLAAARTNYLVPERLGVVAGAGAQALIGALAELVPGKLGTVVSGANGTYSEYARRSISAGRKVSFAADIDAVGVKSSLVWLCRPNNPDGEQDSTRKVLALCKRIDRHGGIAVVDESFADAAGGMAADTLPDNAILLRSFGKFCGLAGLRLGFAIGSRSLTSALAAMLGPWAVSGPAIEIGTAALGDRAWGDAMRLRLAEKSRVLARLLRRRGFGIAGQNALFVLARHDRAQAIAEALRRRHILVRTFGDRPDLLRFGLPATEAAEARLGNALAEASKETV